MTFSFRSLLHFFFASAVIGPGLGYSSLYSFHLLSFILLCVLIFSNLKKIKLPLRKVNSIFIYILYLVFGWYCFGLVWSINTLYTIKYLTYLFFGILLVFFVASYINSVNRYADVFKILKKIFIILLAVGVLEVFTPFRWPTSPFSEYAGFFGRKMTDLAGFNSTVISILKESPTGFFGNSNNFAVVVVSLFPFFVFSKNWKKYFGIITIFIITFFTGSRGALLALLLGIMCCGVLLDPRRSLFIAIFCFLLLVFFSTNIDALKSSDNPRISEMATTGEALFTYTLEADESGGSISVRQQLITNGMNAFWDTYGLGVGGGGSEAVQERLGGVGGKITSMHNFWVEILVEAGVLGICLFLLFYIGIFYKLFKIYRSTNDIFYIYHAGSLMVSMIIFSVACISASSVIYLLPMWLMFGLAIALINSFGKNRY